MMKTWLKRTLLGVAVSTALLGSLAAYSQGGGFHHGPPTAEQMAQHEATMLAHIGKKLNLDANQAAKLKALGDLMIADHAPPAGTDPHAPWPRWWPATRSTAPARRRWSTSTWPRSRPTAPR